MPSATFRVPPGSYLVTMTAHGRAPQGCEVFMTLYLETVDGDGAWTEVAPHLIPLPTAIDHQYGNTYGTGLVTLTKQTTVRGPVTCRVNLSKRDGDQHLVINPANPTAVVAGLEVILVRM